MGLTYRGLSMGKLDWWGLLIGGSTWGSGTGGVDL